MICVYLKCCSKEKRPTPLLMTIDPDFEIKKKNYIIQVFLQVSIFQSINARTTNARSDGFISHYLLIVHITKASTLCYSKY